MYIREKNVEVPHWTDLTIRDGWPQVPPNQRNKPPVIAHMLYLGPEYRRPVRVTAPLKKAPLETAIRRRLIIQPGVPQNIEIRPGQVIHLRTRKAALVARSGEETGYGFKPASQVLPHRVDVTELPQAPITVLSQTDLSLARPDPTAIRPHSGTTHRVSMHVLW